MKNCVIIVYTMYIQHTSHVTRHTMPTTFVIHTTPDQSEPVRELLMSFEPNSDPDHYPESETSDDPNSDPEYIPTDDSDECHSIWSDLSDLSDTDSASDPTPIVMSLISKHEMEEYLRSVNRTNFAWTVLNLIVNVTVLMVALTQN